MERCDRCGGKPFSRHERAGQALWLCKTHYDQHGPALLADGWFTYRIAELVRA